MSINLTSVTSGYNLQVINDNFQKLESALNGNLVWRKGAVSGETLMERDLDMNGHKILNANITGVTFIDERAIRVDTNEAPLAPLPPPDQRAGKLLSFDASGLPILFVPAIDSSLELAQELSSDASGKGDALIGVKKEQGGVYRTQHQVNEDMYSVMDAGAVGDGIADDTAAFTSAFSSGKTVLVPMNKTFNISPGSVLTGCMLLDGTINIVGNCSIASTVIVRGGKINVSAGVTLTYTGHSFIAPPDYIFQGAGSVVGIREVFPEWWGAKSDNSVECSQALNSASSCIAASAAILGVRPKIALLSGRYKISSTWNLPASANIGTWVQGQGVIFSGTRIVASSSFTGDKAVYMEALADGTQRILDFKLSDFAIVPQTPGSGPTYGLQLGTDNLMMNGLRESHVENIYIENFSTGLRLLNSRLIKFSRVGIWNEGMPTSSTNILIQSIGKFSGDLSFENCQIVNRQSISGSRGIHITSNGVFDSTGDRAYQIAGIRFTECILYPADQTVYVAALGGSHIEDLFFTNCQWDGDSNSMFYAVSTGMGSQINDIQIVHNYMYGGNKTSTDSQIQFVTGDTGNINNIRVEGNTLGNGIGRVLNTTTGSIPSITGLLVNGNHIVDFNNINNPAIEVGSGVVRAQINNNIATRTGSAFFPYFVQLDAGSNYYVVTGNLASGIASSLTIREVAPGANRVVANNL